MPHMNNLPQKQCRHFWGRQAEALRQHVEGQTQLFYPVGGWAYAMADSRDFADLAESFRLLALALDQPVVPVGDHPDGDQDLLRGLENIQPQPLPPAMDPENEGISLAAEFSRYFLKDGLDMDVSNPGHRNHTWHSKDGWFTMDPCWDPESLACAQRLFDALRQALDR